jgi:3-oxoacyl-[acyl-carrier protein] reductase
MELVGKSAVVTGASRGIGKAIAEAMAAAGAQVALLARSERALHAVADGIEAEGGRALVIPADVVEEGSVSAAFSSIYSAWDSVDVLVNNAGVQGPIGPLHAADVERWWKAVEVNLKGCFLCSQQVLPHMMAQRGGKIINLSGGGAVSPRPFFSAYSASKAAIVRLTETLAAEVRDHRIDVNAIAPGAVNTEMLKERLAAGERAGRAETEADRQLLENGGTDPQRPAGLAVYLASARSDGLSGRLLSAVWDSWEDLDVDAVMASEAFTVRRLKVEEK